MPTTATAESPLHAACRAGSLAAARKIIDACEPGEIEAIVNAKTAVTSVTPLMLAAAAGGGHGSPGASEAADLARLLLQHGACAHFHSQSRRCAADYAMEHGKPRLAVQLKELATSQLGKESGHRCTLCGDRLGGCKFHAARDAVRRGDERNPLIVSFVNGLDAAHLETLSLPALHRVNRTGNFTRELTEALAMLDRLRRITAHTPDDSWHILDLCCGKAFFATIVGVLHPDYLVHCLDKQPPTYIPHFDAVPSLAQTVRYVRADVLAAGFGERVAELIAANHGRRVVILGMHLCGQLSLRAINLLRSTPRVAALVLSPCCLPAAKDANGAPPSVYATREPAEQYERWCDYLEAKVADAAATCIECSREVETAMISQKNVVLSAVRADTTAVHAAEPISPGPASPQTNPASQSASKSAPLEVVQTSDLLPSAAARCIWIRQIPESLMSARPGHASSSAIAQISAALAGTCTRRMAVCNRQRCVLVELGDEAAACDMLARHETSPISLSGQVVALELATEAHYQEVAATVSACVRDLVRQVEQRAPTRTLRSLPPPTGGDE